MADHRRLTHIGWILGAVTATVIAICVVFVSAGVPQAAAYDIETIGR